MTNDLDSLRTLVTRAMGTGWEAAYRQDVAALVAEVERLRADLDALSRAVGQAVVASSLAAGETLADPIPHIIVWTVTRLRAEALGQRAEASYLRACVPPTHPADYGHEVWSAALRDAEAQGWQGMRAEVAAERAAVVAWLREEANAPHPIEAGERALSPAGRGLLLLAASRIERGEHRREEKP
jgi:hypothetical protein